MAASERLTEALHSGPVILDGGLATLLEAHGHDMSSELWSARLIRDDPDAIVRAHEEFFEAGAEVAISASYQASFDGFARLGMDRRDAEALMRRSVELARAARDRVAPGGWVAASIGPYGAVLADGSEYHGRYGLTVAELRAFHGPRLEVLADAGADVLAIETIPSLAEVEAVLAELDGSGVTAWLSLTADDDRTRAGEPLAEAFAMAADVVEVIAVGVNCLDPGQVSASVASATKASGRPGVAYPNSGQGWDARTRQWTGAPAFDSAAVGAWVEAGARLIGGCCRVGPSEVAGLRQALHPDRDDDGQSEPGPNR